MGSQAFIVADPGRSTADTVSVCTKEPFEPTRPVTCLVVPPCVKVIVAVAPDVKYEPETFVDPPTKLK